VLHRRRLAVLVAFVLLAVAVLVVGRSFQGDDARQVTESAPVSAVPEAGVEVPTAAGTVTRSAATTAAAPADAADAGPTRAATGGRGAFSFVAGYGPVLGESGPVRRFKVAVEKSLGQGNGGDFADEIDRTLGDPRSWIAAGEYRLQRVPRSAGSEFTVYLASAETSEKMCAAGGLRTEGYTSCRLPGQVIINNDRWQEAVPDYGAPLETYRAYAINHEVGHQLGHGHETCPGRGRPAPVMQQQTYGLRGCVANSWPYIDGKRYSGPGVR
jgi:hypothetical protein